MIQWYQFIWTIIVWFYDRGAQWIYIMIVFDSLPWRDSIFSEISMWSYLDILIYCLIRLVVYHLSSPSILDRRHFNTKACEHHSSLIHLKVLDRHAVIAISECFALSHLHYTYSSLCRPQFVIRLEHRIYWKAGSKVIFRRLILMFFPRLCLSK